MIKKPHLIGRENRLIFRRASDFGYADVSQAKVDARDLSRQVQTQQQSNLDAQRAQQTQVNALNAFEAERNAFAQENNVAYTPTNYSRTAGAGNVGTGISGIKLDDNLNPNVVYNDPNRVTMDRSLPTSNVKKPGDLQFGDRLGDAMKGTTLPLNDIEGSVRKRYADMGISDPAIIDNAITSALQADNARNQAAYMASQKASSSASASAASNAAANEMQQSPQTQRALGSLEIGLAGLPPEDAAAIRAGLQATMGAQDQERSAALGNYGDTMGFIDSSEKKSDALLNGMSQDADAFYKAASKFAEENAARREESAARQREETINRLKWEEDKGRRQMKAANDKQVNSLILGQALGGGFGSSNWIAEVADAEWAGEQALVDLSKEFGFKRADVDIAYTNTLDGIYETAGQKKLEALKEYKADRQNISQLRFASSEKNDERRLTAKQTLNDKIAAIGKEQAAEIKAAAGEVRTTLKDMRSEKADRESNAWSRLIDLKTTFGSNVPKSLLDSIAKDLPGIDVQEVVRAKTWAELKEEADNGRESSYDGLLSTYSTAQGETPIDISLVADRVARSYGKTADERAEYKKQIADALTRGQTVEQLLPRLETDFWLSQSGPTKTAHDSRQQTLAGITNINGYLAQYELSSESDGSLGPVSSRFQGLLSVAGLSSSEYNAISAAVGQLRAEIIKDRYGSAVTPQELAIAQSFIPEMNLKGPKFMENLQNLKSYTEYLDKKYFNGSVGLPAPQDPAAARSEAANQNIETEDMTRIMSGGSSSRPAPGPSAMRTDRHMNPTAFTTDLAKQAGLKEGVDYVYDPAIANGFPTAKLLGDPIATTIRVIDNVGFYTQGGKQRWTHTAMSKSQWNSMSLAEKKETIRKMYQREGGTELSSLFS